MAPAGANPWDGPTLEWSVPSPPPPYNFAVIPTVASRHPLWEGRLQAVRARGAPRSIAACCWSSGKETIGTSALEAAPDMILEMPEDTLRPAGARAGAVLSVHRTHPPQLVDRRARRRCWPPSALLVWLWPRRELREREAGRG